MHYSKIVRTGIKTHTENFSELGNDKENFFPVLTYELDSVYKEENVFCAVHVAR
jgi:hypothetical protein